MSIDHIYIYFPLYVAIGALVLLQTGSSRAIVLRPCCLGRICLQLLRVFLLHGGLVGASDCECAWGPARDDIEVWASGEATAPKSLMMPATDDHLKPSMCNQQHTWAWIGVDTLSPAPHPFSKLLILLRGSWCATIHPSRHRGMLPVDHTDNIHIDKHIHTLIHTYRQFRVSGEWNLHVFWCVGGIRSPPAGRRTDTWTRRHSENTLVYI